MSLENLFEFTGVKVYNYKTDKIPPDAVYCMRPSKFSNPFILGYDGNRKEVFAKFEQYVYNSPELIKDIKAELKNKDLVCCCAPKQCHCDILLKIANES